MQNQFNKHALPPGTMLPGNDGVYRIERVLGSGGFGITYLASRKVSIGGLLTTCLYAIKEHFPKELCERDFQSLAMLCSEPVRATVEGTMRDFMSEARRLKKVAAIAGDISVVKVCDVFEANGTAYYVMEYLEGDTLANYVEQHGPLTEMQALSVLRPVIASVHALHCHHMTHLDIKPNNIIIARDINNRPRPVLIDFGLSKHYDENGNATSTINTVGCSPGFAPIEQYSGLKKFSPQSDVYALGATMLFALSGKKPLPADEITPGHIHSMLPDNVSLSIREAIVNAMRYARADRLQSAQDFLKAIDAETAGVTPENDDTQLQNSSFPVEDAIGHTPQGDFQSDGSRNVNYRDDSYSKSHHNDADDNLGQRQTTQLQSKAWSKVWCVSTFIWLLSTVVNGPLGFYLWNSDVFALTVSVLSAALWLRSRTNGRSYTGLFLALSVFLFVVILKSILRDVLYNGYGMTIHNSVSDALIYILIPSITACPVLCALMFVYGSLCIYQVLKIYTKVAYPLTGAAIFLVWMLLSIGSAMSSFIYIGPASAFILSLLSFGVVSAIHFTKSIQKVNITFVVIIAFALLFRMANYVGIIL